MAGQPPYKPFENDKLKWKAPRSETSGLVLAERVNEDLSPRKPALLLFLASEDTGSCCAANYERFIFRDRKVLKLSSAEFVTVRLNRATTDAKVLERFKVTRKRPALIVTDSEGLIATRFDLCTSSSDVLKAMLRCLKTSKKKSKVALQMQERFDDVKTFLSQESYRAAGSLLKKILRTKAGPQAGAVRATRIWKEIEATGRTLHGEANDSPSLTARYDLLLSLRHEFWFFDALAKDVRSQITSLERSEETRTVIHAHNGLKLVAEAEVLIGKGRVAPGRTILRKVRREYAGTEAANKANGLLAN